MRSIAQMFDASRYKNGVKLQVSGVMSSLEFVSILRDSIKNLLHFIRHVCQTFNRSWMTFFHGLVRKNLSVAFYDHHPRPKLIEQAG